MNKRKLVPGDNPPNQEFCDLLNELSNYERTVANNVFKAKAYKKAASAVIAQHGVKLTSGREATKLDGFGKAIGEKLDEFIKTGKLSKLEKIRKDDDAVAVAELSRVTGGIGPAKAKELLTVHNISTIDELRGRQDLLNHHQVVGLRYFEDFETRIPREEMLQWQRQLISRIVEIDGQYTAQICGSFRRGAKTCGDIDILITHPQFTSSSQDSNKKPTLGKLLKAIVDKLTEDAIVTDTLALGASKFAGVCRLGCSDAKYRRLDLRMIPRDQFYCALLYFTGSDVFNQNMRSHALDKGFTLNEYSIRPLGATGVPGEPIEVNSERDIFDIIDYPYKEPHERLS